MAPVACNDVSQQTLLEHGRLGNLVMGIRSTLAWQAPAGDFPHKLSTLRFMAECFQRHLVRMMALEENDGYMELVEETTPWLSRRVEALRNDHRRLREFGRQVVRRLERVGHANPEEFASICDDFTGLLQEVDEHTRNEVALVQEAVDRESGGEG